MLLSSVLQIYSANRFRETPELERLFLSLFAELSNTADFSVKGPDKETIRLIDALRSEGLRPLEEIAVKLGSTEEHITEYVNQQRLCSSWGRGDANGGAYCPCKGAGNTFRRKGRKLSAGLCTLLPVAGQRERPDFGIWLAD